MIKIHQALTDGRNQERKEDLLDILWLQNRLIQVEFERDWIIAEKASLEEVIEEKAWIRYGFELKYPRQVLDHPGPKFAF